MEQLRTLLQTTYLKRSSLNGRYSRNAFARDLGVSPTALSQFLSGKRTFSPKNIRRIVKSLYLPPESEKNFKSDTTPPSLGAQMEIETFSVIADWYHFGILNLTEVETVKSFKQISQRLEIDLETAKDAVARLLKLNLIEVKNGFYKRTIQTLDAGTGFPSPALRKHSREKMELAIASLERYSIEDRDISSLTLSFDKEKIKEIKAEIQKFKKRIQKICEGGSPTEVYSMNIQFHPLSHRKE
ncbi:MAG TPA: TIGR02147 family protein [Bdellovibrio sp.]